DRCQPQSICFLGMQGRSHARKHQKTEGVKEKSQLKVQNKGAATDTTFGDTLAHYFLPHQTNSFTIGHAVGTRTADEPVAIFAGMGFAIVRPHCNRAVMGWRK